MVNNYHDINYHDKQFIDYNIMILPIVYMVIFHG